MKPTKEQMAKSRNECSAQRCRCDEYPGCCCAFDEFCVEHHERRITRALANAVEEERKKCAGDCCPACAGHLPQYRCEVEGPNAAGNYVHHRRVSTTTTGAHTVELCRASGIWARQRFERVSSD